jgi:hypothetical protein
MGLETFGDSFFRIEFYRRLGFRPSWTGVAFAKRLSETQMPDNVEVGGKLPDLGFVYPGLDVSTEVAAVTSCGTGVVLTTIDGLAILHLERTTQRRRAGLVPFLAAPTRRSFDALIAAAEHLTLEHGHASLHTDVPGACWSTIDALAERGYFAKWATVRMKAGENLDYERDAGFYLDCWS